MRQLLQASRFRASLLATAIVLTAFLAAVCVFFASRPLFGTVSSRDGFPCWVKASGYDEKIFVYSDSYRNIFLIGEFGLNDSSVLMFPEGEDIGVSSGETTCIVSYAPNRAYWMRSNGNVGSEVIPSKLAEKVKGCLGRTGWVSVRDLGPCLVHVLEDSWPDAPAAIVELVEGRGM